MDVLRADPSGPDEVLAPVSGPAAVFDWSGNRGAGHSGYSTVVAIYDEDSGAIAQLMHVQPTDALIDAESEFVDVEAGDVIGTLGDEMSWFTDPDDLQLFRHTHLSLIDGERVMSLDPGRFLPYEDDTPPEVVGVYVLDEDAERHEILVSGELDVVVEVFDRDEGSDRNFEVDAIAYEIVDDQGTVLSTADRCNIDDLYADTAEPYQLRTLQLLDFGNARGQVDNAWPGSDIGNRDRTFRYALTQLWRDDDGHCDVLDDEDGFVAIPDAAAWIEVRGTLWDVRENETHFSQRIERTASPPPPPPEEPWTGLQETATLAAEATRRTATPVLPSTLSSHPHRRGGRRPLRSPC